MLLECIDVVSISAVTQFCFVYSFFYICTIILCNQEHQAIFHQVISDFYNLMSLTAVKSLRVSAECSTFQKENILN